MSMGNSDEPFFVFRIPYYVFRINGKNLHPK